MMSSDEFSSTEELYYEASSDEVLYDYNQGSQMRFSENVVYVPRVMTPVMLLEYIPVFYNFQTYEPYLINRYEIMYVPFIRQVSVTSFVPYYYQNTTAYSDPEVISSNTPAVYSNYTQNEADSSQESIFDQASSDELDYEGDFSSSISYSGDTSILSLSSSDPSSSYEYSEFNYTQETSEFVQGFVCTENNDCFDEENNMAREYPERLFSSADEDVTTGGDGCSSSLLLEKDDKDSLELDCPGKYLDPSSSYEYSAFSSTQELSESLQGFLCTENNDCFDEENNIAREYPEKLFSAVEKEVSTGGDDYSSSLLLEKDDKDPAESDCPGNYLDPSSSYEYSEFNSTQEPSESLQGLVYTANEDCFDLRNDDKHKNAREYPEGLISDVDEDVSIERDGCSLYLLLGKDDEDPAELDCPEEYLDHIPFNEERGVEYDASSIYSFVDVETPGSLTESVKVEASSFKDRNLSPERRENHSVFDNDINTRVSNAASLEYVDKWRDDNGLEHQERSPLIDEKITRYDSDTSSSDMLMWSHEKPLQKQDSPHETDVKVPDPFDYVMSENEKDTPDDPGITLEDILASEEYWKVKREEYSRKTRNTDLYKSALQGDIRPRKSLPDVGTMDTIFEDLPYPVNQPYDDGQESKDAYFDLAPLEVQRSLSSKTALLPKKKRFGKTKKFFSQLFGCFRPP